MDMKQCSGPWHLNDAQLALRDLKCAKTKSPTHYTTTSLHSGNTYVHAKQTCKLPKNLIEPKLRNSNINTEKETAPVI